MFEIYKSQESRHIEKLTLETLQDGAWINMIDPSPQELKAISAAANIEEDFLRSAYHKVFWRSHNIWRIATEEPDFINLILNDEEYSYVDVTEELIAVLINLPVVYEKEGYDTLPLAVILTKNYIITLCLEETPIISSFNERTAHLFNTAKKTQFLLKVLYRSTILYMRYLRQINKISEEIEDQLRVSMHNNDILRLMELRKGLTYFSSGLRSNQAVFEKILNFRNNHTCEGVIVFCKEEELLLEDFIIENKSARETVEMYSQILTQLADIFSSVISNNQNMVMEFLAAITMMFAIPTVIAGFFGMNVPVPMKDTPYAFILIMTVAAIAAGFSMYIFYKKRML